MNILRAIRTFYEVLQTQIAQSRDALAEKSLATVQNVIEVRDEINVRGVRGGGKATTDEEANSGGDESLTVDELSAASELVYEHERTPSGAV